VEGVFPSSRAIIDNDSADIEEEQRLFYVAVTRAKQELFLTLYNKGGSGERPSGGVCRFLEPKNVKATYEERSVVPLPKRPSVRQYDRYR
jgi:DNA helicase-2/ATP-dependent DNA helicase PcrA